MPLKITAGLSRKLGQPDYGSVGASCHIECELDPIDFRFDIDSLEQRIRDAYDICDRVVRAELQRQNAHPPIPLRTANASAPCSSNGNGSTGNGSTGNGSTARGRRAATPAQRRAVLAIATEAGVDLDELLRAHFSVLSVDELSVAEASQLIDHLRGLHGPSRAQPD